MTPLRALLSWLILLAIAFLNGAVRQLAYPHALGDFAARQVSAGVAAVAFGACIWSLLRRWPPRGAPQAWKTGALWAALTVVFEIGMMIAEGQSWRAIADSYALWRGSLWPVLVLWLLVAPAALRAVQRSGVAVGPALGWSIAGWLVCGLVFALGRAAFGVDAALVIHLLAAPVVGAAATWLMWRHPRHPGIAATALAVSATPALLDAIVVAPFVERSFSMFASAPGTWIPLGLIFASSAVTAGWLAHGRLAETTPPPARPPGGA